MNTTFEIEQALILLKKADEYIENGEVWKAKICIAQARAYLGDES